VCRRQAQDAARARSVQRPARVSVAQPRVATRLRGASVRARRCTHPGRARRPQGAQAEGPSGLPRLPCAHRAISVLRRGNASDDGEGDGYGHRDGHGPPGVGQALGRRRAALGRRRFRAGGRALAGEGPPGRSRGRLGEPVAAGADVLRLSRSGGAPAIDRDPWRQGRGRLGRRRRARARDGRRAAHTRCDRTTEKPSGGEKSGPPASQNGTQRGLPV
jgi:hypothetical protein